MLKATNISFFIAFFGFSRLVSTKMLEDLRHLDCYECFSGFDDFTTDDERFEECEGPIIRESYLRNYSTSSTTFIREGKKGENMVCEISLAVENLGPPQGMEYLFSRERAIESEQAYITDKGPWKPEEMFHCEKKLAVSGDNSLVGIPVGKVESIKCACISNGCNNMSMEQLIKDFHIL